MNSFVIKQNIADISLHSQDQNQNSLHYFADWKTAFINLEDSQISQLRATEVPLEKNGSWSCFILCDCKTAWKIVF